MAQAKRIIQSRGVNIGGGDPLICTPLVGKDLDELKSELGKIVPKAPDIIEWRADFFSALNDSDAVNAAAQAVREIAGGIPVLLTIRSEKEGGQPISISEAEKIRLIADVSQSGYIDMVDYEIVNEPHDVAKVREAVQSANMHLILSYHNFEQTPEQSLLVNKLKQAEQLGADIAKIAVMPKTTKDILALLGATEEGNDQLGIPMVTISMGGLGTITRMAGFIFGSAFTFAVGDRSSAPGQIPVDELRSAIQLLK